MFGMNPDPCMSYGLADRFTCAKCSKPPRIVKAEGSSPVAITFSCHGETCAGVYTKEQLRFNIKVFAPPTGYEAGSGEKFIQDPSRKKK